LILQRPDDRRVDSIAVFDFRSQRSSKDTILGVLCGKQNWIANGELVLGQGPGLVRAQNIDPRTRTSAADQGRYRGATVFAVLGCKAAARLTPFRRAAVNSMALPMLPAGMAAISSQDASWPTRADKGL